MDHGLRAASLLYLFFQFLVVGIALVPAVLFIQKFGSSGSIPLLAISLGIAYPIFGFTYLLLILIIKRLVGFRSRQGDYPFVSAYSLKWAFVGSLVGLAKILFLGHLKGMPVLNAFYRGMGAKIGRNVLINSCNMFDFDVMTIGDNSFIGGDAVVIGHVGESGMLKIRPVYIGVRCTVGQSSVVFPGATMHDGSVLGALSLLPKGKALPPNTVWGGNPLREIARRPASDATSNTNDAEVILPAGEDATQSTTETGTS